MVPPGGAGIGMHVIPVEKAIETEQEAIGLEKISYWLHKYEGKYAKSMCSCRASREQAGRGLRRRCGELVHRRGRHGRLCGADPAGRVPHL